MAVYSIKTTRSQEIGLGYSYDKFADKTLYPTKESWLQYQVDVHVTNPMFAMQQAASSASFDASFNTIPEAQQPVAKTEIETVITTHGGTIVPLGGPVQPPVPPR